MAGKCCPSCGKFTLFNVNGVRICSKCGYSADKGDSMSKKLTLLIKQVVPDIPIPEKIKIGDWIDLYVSEDVELKQFDFKYIPLGVCIKLPEGYEAILAPRSSTFERWGVLQANSIGIFDETFCGNNDMWRFPAVALRDTVIPKGTRICQFRILKHMKEVKFVEVQTMPDKDRGGWGSTGR